MSKFFVNSKNIDKKNCKITITGEDVNHIKNVLRYSVGDAVNVCNKDDSKNYLSKIVEINSDYIICDIVEELEKRVESNVLIDVYQGIPKADKMEHIIKKGTELGAYSFTPVRLKRCVVKIDKNDETKKIERWQKISEVAAKQSLRDIIPEVRNIIDINDFESILDGYDVVLLAYENERMHYIKEELLKIKNKEYYKIAIIVGPEGGLEESEVELLEKFGAKTISLGNRILRTETAPLQMISVIMYELEKQD